MSETTRFEDLPEDEKQRARDGWATQMQSETDEKLEDWQTDMVSVIERKIAAKYDGLMGSLSKRSGMSAITEGLNEAEAKILKESIKDYSPEQLLSISEHEDSLKMVQNSARFEAAKATNTPETTPEVVEGKEKASDTPPEADEKKSEASPESTEMAQWTKDKFGAEFALTPEEVAEAMEVK